VKDLEGSERMPLHNPAVGLRAMPSGSDWRGLEPFLILIVASNLGSTSKNRSNEWEINLFRRKEY